MARGLAGENHGERFAFAIAAIAAWISAGSVGQTSTMQAKMGSIVCGDVCGGSGSTVSLSALLVGVERASPQVAVISEVTESSRGLIIRWWSSSYAGCEVCFGDLLICLSSAAPGS